MFPMIVPLPSKKIHVVNEHLVETVNIPKFKLISKQDNTRSLLSSFLKIISKCPLIYKAQDTRKYS